MPPSKQDQFLKSITVHAWNKNRDQVALSPNSNEVWIIETKGKSDMKFWNPEPIHKLTEHTEQVTGIDWNHKTNLIVTSSQDRNAYVFKYDDKEKTWKPTLVILRINRSATSVQWSPNGDKFAVTSGAKCVPVCHFEEGNNWWISKMIKKHKSTVTRCAWSPNNKLLVTGSTDYKCRIFSAFIEGIDDPSPDEHFGEKANQFGEPLMEFDPNRGWVHDVAWSPSGSTIAFTTHGAAVVFCELPNKDSAFTYNVPNLPYHLITFLSDHTLLAVGFDGNPTLFARSSNGWEQKGKLDPEKEEKAVVKSGGFGSAFAKFRQADSMGQKSGSEAKSGDAKTLHKNTIEGVFVFRKDGLSNEFSTSGIDGRILFWDANEVKGIQ